MRIRQVKPEFWRDAKLYRLPLEHRAIYIGLWQEADDAGWLRWEPRQITLDILGDWEEAEALAMLKEARAALIRRKRLIAYPCGHAFIPTLAKNQRISEARRVTNTSREHERCGLRGQRGDARGGALGDASAAPQPTPRPVPLGKVREGKVREVKLKGGKHIELVNGEWQPVNLPEPSGGKPK